MISDNRNRNNSDPRPPHGGEPVEEAAVRLKETIFRCWETDKDRALGYYEELLRMYPADHIIERNDSVDNDHVVNLAEKIVNEPGFFSKEIEDADTAAGIVAYLKERVDSFRWKDIAASIDYAKAIIRIGEKRHDKDQEALGLMAMGDSIAISGDRLEEAWDLQTRSARLFLKNGNVLGWARTTIGRTGICIERHCVDETLDEAETALDIFKRYDQTDFYVRLSINMMRLLNEIGKFDRVITLFQQALPAAKKLGEKGKQHILLLHNNIGITHWQRGEFHLTLENLFKAKAVAEELGKKESVNIILGNIAYLENFRGNYKEALRLAGECLSGMDNKNTLYGLRTKRIMAECYVNLNRDKEAARLAKEIINDLEDPGKRNNIDLAHALLTRGTAETKIGLLNEAMTSFTEAKDCFLGLQSETWALYTDLLRGKVMIMQGDYRGAHGIAKESSSFFRKHSQRINLARSLLLEAESLLGMKRYGESLSVGKELLESLHPSDIFSIYYNTNLLMARAEEGLGHIAKSERYYENAIETIENLQQHLTITIRPEFLEDKCEGIHALLRLLLQKNDIKKAFETVERLKTMTILGYLSNRERLYWSDSDRQSRELVAGLTSLRHDYLCLYRLYHERPFSEKDDPSPDIGLLETRIRSCERDMHSIIEKLYLLNAGKNRYIPGSRPDPEIIGNALPDNATLIEYYTDGETLWAFTIRRRARRVHRLDRSLSGVAALLESYYDNINFALQEGPRSPSIPGLTHPAVKLGKELFEALIAPIVGSGETGSRLLIVPFGLLHYVPYNTLHDGERFLIETHEISLLPSAGMLTRPVFSKKPGAVILAHTDAGTLPGTLIEAEEITKIIPGKVYSEKDATKDRLESASVQILHIAAHGRHRIDEPGLSYIRLEDGHLYTEDMLQKDLDYELVTLSACETGKAVVKKSEEMIGLIRGVLFAGAQSIVVSMWRISDEMTIPLMRSFYRSLADGHSKTSALSRAQRELIASRPGLHPAFWGAFHLIGHTGPLTR
ncbi:MAG: CHAT domain-containing protein [Spirochaetales bacterium]|nr:CHAT domain-containing protein [Spirochaetales bacterium]